MELRFKLGKITPGTVMSNDAGQRVKVIAHRALRVGDEVIDPNSSPVSALRVVTIERAGSRLTLSTIDQATNEVTVHETYRMTLMHGFIIRVQQN